LTRAAVRLAEDGSGIKRTMLALTQLSALCERPDMTLSPALPPLVFDFSPRLLSSVLHTSIELQMTRPTPWHPATLSTAPNPMR
jgi:hypothetical protein